MFVLRRFVEFLSHELRLGGGEVSHDVVGLHLGQVELLRTKDRSGSSDSNPTDERLSWDLEVLHGPETDQGTGSTKTSFAVNGNSSILGSKVVLDDVKEASDDVIRRVGAIDEEEIVVADALLDEALLVVLGLIQSDDPADSDVLEDVAVLVGVVTVSVLSVSRLNRTHESHELAGNDPIKVTILDSLVVFVLLNIEGLEVIPSEFDGVLKTLEAVEQSAVVEAVALGGVSVCLEEGSVALELLVSLLGCHLKDDDHECSHEESSVDHLVSWLS